MSKRLPSIIDVARAAGVSYQTVSRVINNKPNVKDETRHRIEKVMKEIGYRPNQAARALATGQTSIIGVLSHDTTLFGPASVLHAVQVAARKIGYTVSLISLKSIYPAAVIAGLEELANIGVEGVIIIAPQSAEHEVLRRVPGNLPAVIIEGEEVTSIPSVEVDQLNGAILATQHLIKLGHKNIAHISGPSGWFSAQRRRDGWQQALSQAKLKALICFEGDWTPSSGYLATKEILKDNTISAIFSANDDMALGAYRAITEAGLSIPQGISIVGFDDTPASAYLSPALTSIKQDFHQVGELAFGLLMKTIKGERSREKKILIAPELMLRGSTAKRGKR